MVWKRPQNETYDERRARIIKASTGTLASYFSNINANKASEAQDETQDLKFVKLKAKINT